MADVTRAHRAVIARVLRGDGRASPALRRAAFDNAGLAAPVSALINKVTIHASKISDADIAAARTAGLNEDQIFEIVVCAALGTGHAAVPCGSRRFGGCDRPCPRGWMR